MKKALSVLLALATLAALFAVSANAVSDCGYVFTAEGDFTSEQISQLNAKAQNIFEKYGVEVYFAKDFGYTASSELGIYVLENSDSPEKGIIYANTEQRFTLDAFGGLQDIFTHEITTWIHETCSKKENYFERAQLYYAEVEQYLEAVSYPTVPTEPAPVEVLLRLKDEQGILKEDEFQRVNAKLTAISENIGMDITILTTDSLGGANDEVFCENYYNSVGYGIGETKSGILLAYNSADGSWYVFSKGFGKEAVNENNKELLMNEIQADFGTSSYEKAFTAFADKCAEYYNASFNAENNGDAKEPTSKRIVIVVVPVLLVLILIIAISKKKKKK